MIRVQGKRITLGRFGTAAEAARAYDRAARQHHGAEARLNFPDESPQENEQMANKKGATATAVKEKKVKLTVDDLSLDDRLQMREKMDDDHTATLAENLADLPPCKVVQDDDGHCYLWDGWHTLYAHELKGVKKIPCVVTDGTWLDAFILAAGANRDHNALRRTNADKRKAVLCLLEENKRGGHGWSKNRIAEMAHVTHTTVNRISDEMEGIVRVKAEQSSNPPSNGSQFTAPPDEGLAPHPLDLAPSANGVHHDPAPATADRPAADPAPPPGRAGRPAEEEESARDEAENVETPAPATTVKPPTNGHIVPTERERCLKALDAFNALLRHTPADIFERYRLHLEMMRGDLQRGAA